METAPLDEGTEDEGVDFDAMASELFNEPVAPETSEPDPAPAPPSEPEITGQPRDATGKFAPHAENAAPADPSAPPPPSAAPAPFRFRSNGQEIPLDGAHVTPDGSLVIPKDALPQAQQLFARGHEYATIGRQREAHYQRELREAREAATRPTEATIRANVVATELAKVLDSDDELVKFINDPQGYRDSLRLRVENQLYRTTDQMRREQQTTRSQQDQQDQMAQAQETEIPTMIHELAEHPSLKGKLTAEDLAHAEKHFAAFKGQLVRQATREEAQQLGVAEGSLIRVQEPVYTLLQHLAATREQYKKEQKAMAEAAKHNNAITAKPKGPPVAGATGKTNAPAPSGKKATPEERRRGAKNALLSMTLEDLED